MEKWRDLGKNLGKPPCKVVPVVQCRMEKGERMVENENWSLLFKFTNVADMKFKTCKCVLFLI